MPGFSQSSKYSKFSLQVDLQDLAGRVIYLDVRHQQTLTGSYSLAHLTVDGDVDVSLINGFDLRHLNSVTVKTTGDFTIKGSCSVFCQWLL